MPFTQDKFLIPTNVVENEEQKLQSSTYGTADILALVQKLATIDLNAKDDQTASEIVAALDAHFGNTDWRTGGSGGGGDLSAADINTLAKLNAIIADATLINTDDARLSDARTPTAHTHTASQISDFEDSVEGTAAVTANTAKNSYPSADAAKVANVPADTGAALALKANAATTYQVVEGAANVARPAGAAYVLFLTPTEPDNALNKDWWIAYPQS